jgi:hypothetical protein
VVGHIPNWHNDSNGETSSHTYHWRVYIRRRWHHWFAGSSQCHCDGAGHGGRVEFNNAIAEWTTGIDYTIVNTNMLPGTWRACVHTESDSSQQAHSQFAASAQEERKSNTLPVIRTSTLFCVLHSYSSDVRSSEKVNDGYSTRFGSVFNAHEWTYCYKLYGYTIVGVETCEFYWKPFWVKLMSNVGQPSIGVRHITSYSQWYCIIYDITRV